MHELCFFLIDKNTSGYVLKTLCFKNPNFMQLDLKEKQFSPDNTFPGSLHFPLLIKTLSYVLIIHLNHKCLRQSLLYTTKRQLIM